MTWISINPKVEPLSSVEVVANYYGLRPEEVSSADMAVFYNNYFDPSLCQLSVSKEPAPRQGTHNINEEE